jgi:hypothetical protein
MTELRPEYGAIHGMASEWTSADLAASQAQQASMDAQRSVRIQNLNWTGLDAHQRSILIQFEKGEISEDEAGKLLLGLEISNDN